MNKKQTDRLRRQQNKKKKTSGAFTRGVFQVFHAGRNAIRRFARQENGIGHCCSYLVILYRYGFSAANGQAMLWRNAQQTRSRSSRELTRAERALQRSRVFSRKVTISLLVPLYNTDPVFLKDLTESVLGQTYRKWEICFSDASDGEHPETEQIARKYAEKDSRIKYQKLPRAGAGISENTNACIRMAEGEYLALLDHDDLLHPAALYEVMKEICDRDADVIYTDEAVFQSPDPDRIISIHYKPDFAPDSLRTNNYICHFCVFRASLLQTVGLLRKEYDGSQDYDLILRLTDAAERVAHIPKVLYYWRSHPKSTASDPSEKPQAGEAGRMALKNHLMIRRGIDARVDMLSICPSMYRVSYPIQGEPTVRVVIRADNVNDAWEEKNRKNLEQLISRMGYYRCFVSVFSAETTELSSIRGIPVSVHSLSSEETYEQAANRLSETWQEDYYVFLDGGLQCIAAGWLREMLMLAQLEHIGAVGAKILFQNCTVRHAGLVLGLGTQKLVGRSHFRIPGDTGGYYGQLEVVENVSAVSMECMMVSSRKFREAGRFSEEFGDTLADVDLCLKLLRNGLLNVYTPYALLRGGNIRKYHMNYDSEKKDYRVRGRLLREKWPERMNRPDPYFNPNLDTRFSDFRSWT